MERNLSIRLSVKDHEAVKRALEGLGRDGQAALQKIEQGGAPASRSLLAVNAASQEVQGGISGLAGRAGPLGSVLTALGPAGMAAAAGIAAVVVGLTAAIDRSRQAVEKFTEINKTADRLKVSTTVLQELRYAAERVGIGAEAADEGLKELGIRAAEAAEGSGQAVEGFRKLGITQADLKRLMNDMPGLLNLIAERFGSVKTAAEQAFIADAIMGDVGGESLVVLLRKGADGLRQFREEAHALGVVIEKDMLDRATETNRQLSVMHTVIDANLNQAFVDLLPVIMPAVQAFADMARWIGEVADGMRDIENRTTSGLKSRLEEVTNNLNRLQARRQTSGIGAAAVSKQVADLRAEKEALEKELAERKAREKPTPVVVPPKPWNGKPAGEYTKDDDDPVKDAKARFQRAVANFNYNSGVLDQEIKDRNALDQTARELMEYANKLREPQRRALEEQEKEVRRIIEANARQQVEAISKVGDAIDRSVEDNLQRSAAGYQSWGDSVKAVIADVANQLIKLYLMQSTGNSIGGWIAQGVSSWVGGLGGGATPGTVMAGNTSPEGYFGPREYGGSTSTGGPRAAGGQVFPGLWYPTNERRAEDTSAPGWFMPVRPGVISPDSAGGSGGGAAPITVQFNLTAQGASQAEVAQLRAMMQTMAADMEPRVVAAVQSARRKGQLRGM